jgi:mono/diheme cytochrome c family protein
MNDTTGNRGTSLRLALGALLSLGAGAIVTAQQRPPPAKEPWVAPARAAQRRNPLAADGASVTAGKTLYTKMCVSCHGKTGRGDGAGAKDLDVDPGDFSAAKPAAASDGELFWKITEGRKPMPKYGEKLTEDERWQVINYLRTFAPGAAAPPASNPASNVNSNPAPAPAGTPAASAASAPGPSAAAQKRPPPAKSPWLAPADAARRKNPLPAGAGPLAAGKTLYTKMCASCHGAAGHGDGADVKKLAVDPGDFTAVKLGGMSDGELFWKISQGRKPMPKYGARLTETQRWQVIRYLRGFGAGGATPAK